MYSYRTSPFLKGKELLLYGLGSLFVMGLGLRNLYLHVDAVAHADRVQLTSLASSVSTAIWSWAGSFVAELGEVLADLRDRRSPAVAIDREQGRRDRRRSMSRPSVSIAAGVGRRPIGVSIASAVAVDPLEHPLEHAAVLAEPGPQEPAVLVATEPVDEEDLRAACPGRSPCRSSASGRSSRRSCSRRTAASPSGRSAARPLVPSAAAVFSDAMIDPRNTPCSQSNASVTNGTVVRRRPPNRIAEIGTPFGSSHSARDRRALRCRGREAGVRVGGRACRTRGSTGCRASRWRGPGACRSCLPTRRRRRR